MSRADDFDGYGIKIENLKKIINVSEKHAQYTKEMLIILNVTNL